MKITQAIRAYQDIQENYNNGTRAASCKLSQHMNWYRTYINLRDLRNEINDNTRKSAKKTELLEAIDKMKEHINGLVGKYLGVDIRHEIFKRENQEQHADNFKSRAKEEREEIIKQIEGNLLKWDRTKALSIEALESGDLDKNLITVIKGLNVSIFIDEEGDYFLTKDGEHIHINRAIVKPSFLDSLKALLFKICVEPITAETFEQEANDDYYNYWQHDADYWTERD